MMVSKVGDVLDLKTGSAKLKVEELATFQLMHKPVQY
jgi:hypothetical protein